MIPEGAIISGFISKMINDLVDVTKDKIKKADSDRKAENQSFETRIYQVIIDAINEFTYGKYANQDILYDAAENMLNGFKNSEKDNIVAVKFGLENFILNVDDTGCEKFIRVLCHEISKENNFDVYKEILLILLNQKNDCNYDKLRQIRKKLDEVILKLDNQTTFNKKIRVTENAKFLNSKKQKYIENWNSRLFLHMNNDENSITLADAFIMPDYKIYNSIERIGFSEDDTLDKAIDRFINYDKTSTLIITGAPGMGKTSIISWIANEYKDNDDIIVLRFRDWESEELENGLLKAICNTLECKKNDLETKSLILDGFDEIKELEIIDNLFNAFVNDMKDFENFKCIITSRPAYINGFAFQNYFKLIEFDIDKVEIFYKKITGNGLDKKENIESDLEVLGIPVILYMVIMSKVDISENLSKPEIYNSVFSERGGIFDKFYNEGIAYDSGSQIMRNHENIKKYLRFLREVAFEMHKSDSLLLQKGEFQIPKLEFQGKYISILEFPIKHLFGKSELEIEFVHKSIYEYFVSECIFELINKTIDSTKEELAAALGELLCIKMLYPEVIEFLAYKIRHSKLLHEYDSISESFQLMLQNGMIFYTGKCVSNTIVKEMNVFLNMLEILHLWGKRIKLDKVGCNYLKINKSKGINLSNMDLIDFDLSNSYLVNANLSGTNLSETTLRNANLERVKLDGAILKGTDLRGTILIKADFSNAILESVMLEDAKLYKTNFSENQIRYLANDYDMQEDRVATTEYKKFMNIKKNHHNVSNSQDSDMSEILCQREIDELLERLNFTMQCADYLVANSYSFYEKNINRCWNKYKDKVNSIKKDIENKEMIRTNIDELLDVLNN